MNYEGKLMIHWESAYRRMLAYQVIRESGCWESLGKARIDGYPVIRVKIKGQWRMRKFAKVALMMNNPGRGLVLHRCNNVECWNPQHLYWGSYQDNANDRVNAGTVLKGEDHPQVKLTVNQVNEIRHRGQSGESSSSIAIDFPINRRQVSRIIAGKRWVLS